MACKGFMGKKCFNNSGSAKTIPAGIKSLKEIEMSSLSKFIEQLKITSARECLEDQGYINMIFEIDQEYLNLQNQITDLEKRLEEKTSISPAKAETGNNEEKVKDELKNDETELNIKQRQQDLQDEIGNKPINQSKDDKTEDKHNDDMQRESRNNESKQPDVNEQDSTDTQIQLKKDEETRNKQQDELQHDGRDTQTQLQKDKETIGIQQDELQQDSTDTQIQLQKDEETMDTQKDKLKQDGKDTKIQLQKDEETMDTQKDKLKQDGRDTQIQLQKDEETQTDELQEEIIAKKNEAIQRLIDKINEKTRNVDALKREVKTTENEKNKSEEEYERLKTAYGNHLRQSQEKIQEYKHKVDRLNSTINHNKLEIQIFKENEIKLNEQVNDLKLRLSQVAGFKLSENNPSITDLSDPNRPQKIAEEFSELYDNEWTDAFEMLTNSGKEERSAIDILLNTLKVCFEYCKQQSDNQQKQIADALRPTESADLSTFTTAVAKSVKDLRKMTDLEEHWITWLYQQFLKSEVYNSFPEERNEKHFLNFVNGCLKCGWLSNVQDPPVVLDFNLEHLSRFDSDYTKAYTKQGQFVDFVVWPCMLRCESGALLMKGVVQCTDDKIPKSVPEVSSAVDLLTTSDTAEITDENVESKINDADIDYKDENDNENTVYEKQNQSEDIQQSDVLSETKPSTETTDVFGNQTKEHTLISDKDADNVYDGANNETTDGKVVDPALVELQDQMKNYNETGTVDFQKTSEDTRQSDVLPESGNREGKETEPQDISTVNELDSETKPSTETTDEFGNPTKERVLTSDKDAENVYNVANNETKDGKCVDPALIELQDKKENINETGTDGHQKTTSGALDNNGDINMSPISEVKEKDSVIISDTEEKTVSKESSNENETKTDTKATAADLIEETKLNANDKENKNKESENSEVIRTGQTNEAMTDEDTANKMGQEKNHADTKEGMVTAN